MVHVTIENEYSMGPLWYRDEDDYLNDGPYGVIANDKIAMDLAEQARTLYDSYFDFQTKEKFFSERERAHVGEMLEIISKLKARLDQINDGSYVVYDYESERIKKDYPTEYELYKQNNI